MRAAKLLEHQIGKARVRLGDPHHIANVYCVRTCYTFRGACGTSQHAADRRDSVARQQADEALKLRRPSRPSGVLCSCRMCIGARDSLLLRAAACRRARETSEDVRCPALQPAGHACSKTLRMQLARVRLGLFRSSARVSTPFRQPASRRNAAGFAFAPRPFAAIRREHFRICAAGAPRDEFPGVRHRATDDIAFNRDLSCPTDSLSSVNVLDPRVTLAYGIRLVGSERARMPEPMVTPIPWPTSWAKPLNLAAWSGSR